MAVAATCINTGLTEGSHCSVCETVLVAQEVVPATGNHTYGDDGVCTTEGCDAVQPTEPETPAEPTTLATFNLGANGTASHSDGSSKTSYSETVNGYTLSLTNTSQFYTGARDAKGNSCIKLGSSGSAGKFTFTVANDVTKVVIYVAGYKANTAKVSINGGATQTISTLSNNGEYTAIEIDTSTNKTVSFTTVSGGYRAMVNTIEFIGIAK